MIHINDLPEELLEYILYLVSPYADLKSCRLVCQRWSRSCMGVVQKRKSRFIQALKKGCIEWQSLNITYPNSSSAITRRYSHSACIHGCYMYVFGGCTATNTTFNDLWKFNLGSHQWTRMLTTGTYPSPKAYACMVSWNDYLILFGGWTHPSVYPLHQQWVLFNELHVYNILENRWTQLYYDMCPPATAGHTATIHDDVLVVFGGLQKQEGLSSSTNEIFCLNIVKHIWFQPHVSSLKPDPRYGHSQIKISERHLLILSGCGGSNNLYSDVWLLTLPENFSDGSGLWQWTSISVHGAENMPTQMWYNPACKAGNQIVMLSTWQHRDESAPVTGKMHQLFVPGRVRREVSPNIWLPPSNPIPAEANVIPAIPNERMELNVNGQRGSLRNPVPRHSDASTSSDSDDNSEYYRSIGYRPKPSIRPNASSNREKRLEVLSRMESRLRLFKGQIHNAEVSKPKCSSPENRLVAHVMNIENLIETESVTWQPIKLNAEGLPHYLGSPPEPCLLYSLLRGRGHFVMFGGIPNDPTGSHNKEAVSNEVTFLSSPSLLHSSL